mmetsp:Transcript_2361/g.3394  ORF Transcript_2361/g.3394 Transcript_2361/m.3394 type:complete len:562 (+) Transcript_2361:200-1885(+)
MSGFFRAIGQNFKPRFRRLTTTSKTFCGQIKNSVYNSDLLVIGSGIAGVSAALKAAESGLNVTMLSSARNIADCNSYWAQGGIIYKSNDDRPKLLADDIHKAGAGICDDSAVMKLAVEGPKRVEEILLKLAPVEFNRDSSGRLLNCLEAGHSRARIIHWHDQTGMAITNAVQKAAANHPNINVVTNATATDLALAVNPNCGFRCAGAHVLLNGAYQSCFLAPATVLATGGMGEIYAHTSNPKSARGDGFAMASRAGASMNNMEYVQFHPTTLYTPNERSFLLTEALRGEGAVLRDLEGRAFAKDYHPSGELAPRDIVSRMIISEMAKSCSPHMFLDITHRERDWLKNRFPGIFFHLDERGIDMSRDYLPIVPAAHYFCGGVSSNLKGETSLPGLYAAGEVACTGLHGGNRLASTSLLEGLVWGTTIGENVSSSPELERLNDVLIKSALLPPLPNGKREPDLRQIDAVWKRLKSTMWKNVGVIRTYEGLVEAVDELTELSSLAQKLHRDSVPNVETVGLKNGVDTALCIAKAAYNNPYSIGAHFLADETPSEIDGLKVASSF